MSGIGYRIRRSQQKQATKFRIRKENALLLGHLNMARALLVRPFLGRLKWAFFKR